MYSEKGFCVRRIIANFLRHHVYVHRDIPKDNHKTFRQSDKADKWRDGPIDGQICGWTDIGKDRQTEIHQDKTQTRQTYRLHLLFMLIYRYITMKGLLLHQEGRP